MSRYDDPKSLSQTVDRELPVKFAQRLPVNLGDRVRDVHAGATVFAPANTWIEVTNIGTEVIHGLFVFSAPGFEDFMRAESLPPGQKITPLSKAEDAKIMQEHAHAVIYAGP